MSLEKKQEKRRRKIQELILMGYSYNEIAEKLGVSPPTIVEDVKALNQRYSKMVADNHDYLNRQVEHIFKLLDEFDLIKKELWVIVKKQSATDRDKISATGNLIKYLAHKAKVLNLIQVDKTTFNQTYIKIEKLQPVLERVIYILRKYVPENKLVSALEELKTLEVDKNNG